MELIWTFSSEILKAENNLNDQKANFLQTSCAVADIVEMRGLNQMSKSLDRHIFPHTGYGEHHLAVYLPMVDYISVPWVVFKMSAGNPRCMEEACCLNLFYRTEL